MTTQCGTDRFTDAQRMELRSYVQVAGECVSQYWPMRTFIHHNPLHGLEGMPFEQAVQHAERLFGGRGYLSHEEYRRHFREGRITREDLLAALESIALDKSITFAGQRFSHQEILAAVMMSGLADSDRAADHADGEFDAERVLTWLRTQTCVDIGFSHNPTPSAGISHLSVQETLSAWCDATLGTTLVEGINREMVKWCSSFLDEGEAGWSMPGRDQTFYRTWKSLAVHDFSLRLMGITEAAAKIRALPDRPEEAVLEHLAHMRIPKSAWESYLALHLATLPGWTGYLKWRSQQTDHPWQAAYPADLVKYLAVRLFYERELADAACRDGLGIEGHEEAIRRFVETHSQAYRLRCAWVNGQVGDPFRQQVGQMLKVKTRHAHHTWDELGLRHEAHCHAHQVQQRLQRLASQLVGLSKALERDPGAIDTTTQSDLQTLGEWLDGFSSSMQSSTWLSAFEGGYRRRILQELSTSLQHGETEASVRPSRALAQVVFCIDVRAEVFRRHLEQLGGYETFGLAGFFGVPLDYQPFGAHQPVAHCPVLLKPKNRVHEIPRSYQGLLVEERKQADQLTRTATELLHDLKGNVVTPYVMVEAIGWFFGVSLLGKTLFPTWYAKVRRWAQRVFMPSLATTLTVERLQREEAKEMVATEQRAIIREVVRQRFALDGAVLSPTLLEKIRQAAMGDVESGHGDIANALSVTPEMESAFYQELRDRHRISPRGVAAYLDRLTHAGFSSGEQAYIVEAALRLMGLTANFARIVLFCAHGSTSQNNPYEAALDCGACGGNHGLPNARTIAAMANKPTVRELLKKRGIMIPADTQFLAAEHDTTTDDVRVVDLEDVPATHRKDLERLLLDLDRAGEQVSLERAQALAPCSSRDARSARQSARRRSEDWAEVRPEWGLSKNSLIVIGRRVWTQHLNLEGRSFLHSYDYRQDAAGKILESIMTAPLVVAQWINMEHYFSSVDNEVYGSGSKVYHNVVGRIGVMTGVWSDLRLGLPAQTVLNGSVPYHEPMRLLTIIEGPKDRIDRVINKHPLLDQLTTLGWITIIALDPADYRCYRYDRVKGWTKETQQQGGGSHGWTDIAPDEGNQDHCAGRPTEICH
ncbi:DUF2309 domain-containing protein [Nitrospira sp. CMX1]|nr:DUF2309 domain-containing protein [Nitrospira sp.]